MPRWRKADRLAKLASAAKAKVGEAGRYVGEQAVQLHGGMGMTEELKVGHYLKRLSQSTSIWRSGVPHLRCAEDVF